MVAIEGCRIKISNLFFLSNDSMVSFGILCLVSSSSSWAFPDAIGCLDVYCTFDEKKNFKMF